MNMAALKGEEMTGTDAEACAYLYTAALESLRDDQTADLNRLKEWLYRKRTNIRLDRDRAERRQKKEEEAGRRKAEQPALFTF